MGPDDEICLCFHVTRRRLERHVRINHPRVASQMSECGGAGTGCGWCVPFLKQIFVKGTVAEELSADDYAQRRAAYRQTGQRDLDPNI